MAGLDGGIDLLEIQQAIGSAHLVHLGIDAGGDDLGLARKTEILQVVNTLLGLRIVHDHGTTLYRVIDLGGMEREGGHITSIEDTLAIDLHTEGMGGIIDNLQAILVGNLLDSFDVAGFAIDMDGHDGGGLGGDGGLNLVRIDIARLTFDVHKDGLDAIPPQGMGRGHEGIGRGDDLTGNP